MSNLVCTHPEAIARFLLPITVSTPVSVCFQCTTCGERRKVATLDADWRRLWEEGQPMEPSITWRGREYFAVPTDLPQIGEAEVAG
ncbi:hypothetical protein LCGC14_2989200 [marine sediment metagenome]|uniref:Uncharacterized protein n=1 Tax=marine sediment metagenome TaxID=412755 RepID=A0A0F8ZBV1_9ZZZZ